MAHHSRTDRERKTIKAMIGIYCQNQHGRQGSLCNGCDELLHYANCRLDRCPFPEQKPPCANCAVHCYKPAMRDRIRLVMRFAGPRMIVRHPILALRHLLDVRLHRRLNE